MQTNILKVYVCPSEGCDNYYGSANMGNLSEQENIAYVVGEGPKSRGFRTRCPQCGAERVLRYAKLIPEDKVEDARRKAMASPEVSPKPLL